MTEIGHFAISLNETLAWCRQKFEMSAPASSLRSKRLKPLSEHLIFSNDEANLVQHAIDCRSEILRGPNDRQVKRPESWNMGVPLNRIRFLVYFPSSSLSDGTSPIPTGGFLNEHDCPPWDTWIHFHENYLLSLVPPELESAVDIAISINSTECIQWLEDFENPFADKALEFLYDQYFVRHP